MKMADLNKILYWILNYHNYIAMSRSFNHNLRAYFPNPRPRHVFNLFFVITADD
jgi:hypothetical protein